jgi:hypothetical protein
VWIHTLSSAFALHLSTGVCAIGHACGSEDTLPFTALKDAKRLFVLQNPEGSGNGENFECLNCGYQNHVDYNAAKNIGFRYLRRRQNAADRGAPVDVRLNRGTLNVSGEYVPLPLRHRTGVRAKPSGLDPEAVYPAVCPTRLFRWCRGRDGLRIPCLSSPVSRFMSDHSGSVSWRNSRFVISEVAISIISSKSSSSLWKGTHPPAI